MNLIDDYLIYIEFILKTDYFMRSILYLIAVILLIGWLLGVFVYSAAGIIHVLLVLAIIALILGVIRRA
jgi:Family of unknown function (DUF5670)